MITALVLLGQVLELRARSRTSGAIRALLGLAPKTARPIASDGTESDVPLDRVQPGDRLRVRPGEKVPLDGVVVEGRSSVDESMISGVTGTVAGRRVLLGNRSLLDGAGIDAAPLAERAEALRADGQTVMFVVVDGRLAGLIAVSDPIKASSAAAAMSVSSVSVIGNALRLRRIDL